VLLLIFSVIEKMLGFTAQNSARRPSGSRGVVAAAGASGLEYLAQLGVLFEEVVSAAHLHPGVAQEAGPYGMTTRKARARAWG
jgi:hypothetical protein